MSNVYLVINIAFWAVTIAFYQKKKKHIDSGSVILASFLIFSISSYIHFNSSQKYDDLTFFPFVYLDLMIILFLYPVLKYDDKKISSIQKPNRVLIYPIIYIFIFSSLIFFVLNITEIYSGVFTILANPTGGLDIYRDTMDNSFNVGDGIIQNIFAIFSNSFFEIGILLYFFYLTRDKKNTLTIILFSLSIFLSVLAPIAQSQRGPAVDRLLTIIIAYFCFKEFLPLALKTKLKRIGVLFVIIISIPLTAITISRFGSSKGSAMSSVHEYIGMQNLNFNNYGFDNGGLRNGDRTIPLFKRMVGYDDVPYNFWQRRAKYPNLKINDEVFIGFVGDFVLDFGPFISSLIFLIFTFFSINQTRVKKGIILFHQLTLLYFIMCVCIQGGIKLFSFSDNGGNLRLIVFFFAYLSFRLDYYNQMKRS